MARRASEAGAGLGAHPQPATGGHRQQLHAPAHAEDRQVGLEGGAVAFGAAGPLLLPAIAPLIQAEAIAYDRDGDWDRNAETLAALDKLKKLPTVQSTVNPFDTQAELDKAPAAVEQDPVGRIGVDGLG